MTPQGPGGSDARDPEETERALRQAEARGVGGAGLADLLDRSAAAHRRRFWNSGDTRDLHRAVDRYRRAVRADPARRAVWSNELAVSLTDLYDVTGTLTGLNTAIDLGDRASAALPRTDRAWARVRSNVGMLRMDR
ncbi:hypothetical protein QFZ56_007586 [Streptomyces achromogenes]|uniref:Uncharacterized protein n=1 Tax=Streptomyces achromogenes TaxID=67255 RepID=A0ABU0QD90_STRAH|nr:hypothetical protein [Streptomyces achromogenes]MDQ0688623.1 hypothetical protein [Streptomyces achromogenes]